MPYLNVKERTLETKVVYYGAGLSGKTTNLEKIKEHAAGERTGDMMSLNTDGDRTLFFDYLPYELGKFNGCDVKVQLFTVPGQTKYAETRKRVLAGADGVVLVLDSAAAALDRNRQTLADLREHLEANGLPAGTPIVLQANKQDLPDAMSVDALLEALDLEGYPCIEAVALKGDGVFETLKRVVAEVLASIRESARSGGEGVIGAGEKSGLDGESLRREIVPGAEEEAAAKEAAAKLRAEEEEKRAAAREATPTPAPPLRRSARPSSGANGTTGPARPVVGRSGGHGGAAAAGAAAVARAPSPQEAPRPRPQAVPDVEPKKDEEAAVELPPELQPLLAVLRRPETQLNEVVRGHRALSRRVDAVISALRQEIGGAVSESERSLLTRLESLDVKLSEKLGASLEGVRGEVDGALAGVLEKLQAEQGALAELVEGQRGAFAEQRDAASAELAALEGALLGRLEALAGALEAQTKPLVERVDELDARIAPLAAQLRALGAKVSPLREDLQGLRESQGEVVRAELAPLGAAVEGLEQALATMRDEQVGKADLDRSISSLSGLVLEVRSQHEGLSERVEEQLAQQERVLGVAHQHLQKLTTHQERLETLMTDAAAEVASTHAAVDQALKKAEGVQTELAARLDALGARLDKLENQTLLARREAKEALGSLPETVIGGLRDLVEGIQVGVDKLGVTASRNREALKKVDDSVGALHGSSQEARTMLRALGSRIDGAASTFEEQAGAIREELSEARGSVESTGREVLQAVRGGFEHQKLTIEGWTGEIAGLVREGFGEIRERFDSKKSWWRG